MDRVGVFVDAGYLFASAGVLLVGTKVSRGELELDIPAVAATLKAAAEEVSHLPLLRIYWYDGTDSGPSKQHTELAFQDEIKVRLGIVNRFGEQKGVDSLLVTDMINLARSGAMATAVLITGDEDIRVGVQQAQDHGVRVHLIGIEPVRHNQSNLLPQEADTKAEWGAEKLAAFLQPRAHPSVAAVQVPAGGSPATAIAAVVDAVLGGLDRGSATRCALSSSVEKCESHKSTTEPCSGRWPSTSTRSSSSTGPSSALCSGSGCNARRRGDR